MENKKVRRINILALMLCVYNLYALSSDDFIIQQSINNRNVRYRPKIYLGQNWGEAKIEDNLLKTETYKQWGTYEDVVIYYYESIEIVAARYIPNAPYRTTVQITIIGGKYLTTKEITVGNSINDVIAIYGKSRYEQPHEGMIYSIYEIDNPYSDYMELQSIRINYVHQNGLIQRIRVSYAYSI